ncbi:aminotransferase class III-fold pyridoxal phosphate-dependent enzyme [Pseudodesulfovibrio sp.]|nr:aminotransferase class III-fold pyridoxal phosphate-dependent enzyme [Pseudodesulfovibrio sp.]
MNSGQKLWQEAKSIIPGGSQLLSKRAERFLPGLWPAYYDKAKGCEVWDLDGNHYFDFAQMGVGSCSLGYADDDINKAVSEVIDKGSMCTLNAPEEVALAKKLIALHPWSDMARFARTGGEACAIAIRIARAATGKDRVAFCGYHGWHDWYIAANLADDAALDGQLLPGLEPKGLHRGLGESALPFHYNKIEELEAIVNKHNDIGVIIMEPQRGKAPAPGFLEKVREIATSIGAALVFDEVTSGFRVNLGGIHLTYGVEPDLTVFGKALGNGYPIAAIIGRGEFMDAAQNSFISSTMWTERIGFTAALATIEKMERNHVQKDLVHHGDRINAGWQQAADSNGLKIQIDGIPPLTHLGFEYDNPLAVQTLYAQEMLERGYLMASGVYTTYAYTDKIVDNFLAATNESFVAIKKAMESGGVEKQLKGDVLMTGFVRLT